MSKNLKDASVHIWYEYWMLVKTAQYIFDEENKKNRSKSEKLSVCYNTYYESFGIHCRGLLDFMCIGATPTRDKEKEDYKIIKKDNNNKREDIKICDYIINWDSKQKISQFMKNQLNGYTELLEDDLRKKIGNNINEINSGMAHITQHRYSRDKIKRNLSIEIFIFINELVADFHKICEKDKIELLQKREKERGKTEELWCRFQKVYGEAEEIIQKINNSPRETISKINSADTDSSTYG